MESQSPQVWRPPHTPHRNSVSSLGSRTDFVPEDYDSFYTTFDKMGSIHVEQSVKSLSDQLDNLLLFAGLFSAINSAFLVFSLPNLGSPNVQTNDLLLLLIEVVGNNTIDGEAKSAMAAAPNLPKLNLAVNALFSTSLICSLITAFFAVVGKQWLTHYSKQNIGSVEQMRKEVQSKIIGAQHYYLHEVLDGLLMTIIEVALLLFILGFILFLVTINMKLTYIVVPFAATGFFVYLVTVGLALWDANCPFQTPVTTTIIPACCRLSYRVVNAFISFVEVVGLCLILTIDAIAGRSRVHERQTDLDKAFGSFIARLVPPHRSYESDPEWDVYYHRRHQLAQFFKRKPYQGQFNIGAACWVVETAREEDVVRNAAGTFLLLENRADFAHVAAARHTILRLRTLIRLTDEDLSDEERRIGTAQDPLELKEKEWTRLSFYVHVLSHIFAGMEHADPAWYDRMDKIYLYQTMRARKDSRKHTHTIVPARMVGIIKILLAEAYGIHIHAKDSNRDAVLRNRLYACVAESGCSAKALSLTAFAMRNLPRVCTDPSKPPKPTPTASGPRGTSAVLGIVGAWPPDERSRPTSSASSAGVTATLPSFEFKDAHDELWHIYIRDDPDEICRSIVGAMQTYSQRHASPNPSPALPTRDQFVAFLQRVGEHVKVHKPTKTSPTYRKFFVEACAELLRSLKTSQADEQTDGHLLYQETHSLLRLSIDHVTENMAYDAQELIVVSEWCPLLVKLHLDIQGDGEILHRARDIMRICHTALNERDKSHVKELGRAFVPLVVATGQLLIADGPVHPEAGPEREAFIAEGVILIGAMTGVLLPGQLGNATSLRIAFASQEAVTAMHHFMEVSKSNHTPLTTHQSQFMQQYGRLLREVKAVRWMSLGDRRRELMEEIKVRVGEDPMHEPEGGVVLGGNGNRCSPMRTRPPRELDAFR